MKSIMKFLLMITICVMLVSCENSADHIGEVKIPLSSSALQGCDYESIEKKFSENGFTNIRLEKIEDLITGWMTKDGEVEKVTVDGKENYSAGQWFSPDVEVVIYYHTFPNNNTSKIKMENSSTFYEGDQWTLESLTEHFKSLGFTSFENIPCDPSDDNYHSNIFMVEICTGWFSEDPWVAGDEFNSDDKIKIYYNEFPLLTIENCSDLLTILTSKDIDYLNFAKTYDGCYVEFDAYVAIHNVYDGGVSHIIDVVGGDYDGVSELGHYDENYYNGLLVRIGDRTWGNSINENVKEGDNVKVSGKIDLSWCKYYKQIYVETRELSKR